MPRTITGLDVQEDFSCEVLDLAQKITIMGETPSSKKVLAYKPDNNTTVYRTIDAADDNDINSLITDADGLMNKKITPWNLFTPKAVTGTAPVVSSDPTGTSTVISMDVIALDEATSAGARDTLLIEQSGVNKKISPENLFTPKAMTGPAPVVSSAPTRTSTAISMDVMLLDEATSAGARDTLLIEQSGVNKKVTPWNGFGI
jgi:hypothetical protein